MGAAEKIAVQLPAAPPKGQRRFAVGASLLRAGVVASEEMLTALSHQGREAGRLTDVLRTRGLVVERDLLGVDARNHGIRVLDIERSHPDPRLIDAVGTQDCLRHGIVPWQKVGAVTVIATSRPADFHRIRPMLEARLGPVAVGIDDIELARERHRPFVAADVRTVAVLVGHRVEFLGPPRPRRPLPGSGFLSEKQ